jgi:hypothetical protein
LAQFGQIFSMAAALNPLTTNALPGRESAKFADSLPGK